jgi:hypothetical protein
MIGAVAGTAPFVTAAALFAALGVASGKVIGARHRPKDSAIPAAIRIQHRDGVLSCVGNLQSSRLTTCIAR